MGGDGSGRKVDVVKKMVQAGQTPFTSNGIYIPNYSGLQAVKLTDPAISSGGSGHTIQEEGVSLTARTNLNFSGSGVTAYDDAANNATVVSITTSGGAETDPVYMALSGSMYDKYLGQQFSGSLAYILSGSTPLFALSGGATVSLGTHITTATNPHGVNITQTGATITTLSGSNASFTVTLSGASLSEGPNRVMLSGSTPLFALSGGATVSLGTHITTATNPHGGLLTQTGIIATTLSGTNIINIGDHNTSGSDFVVGVIMDASPTPPTANLYPQGTLYIQYTP